jgi:beta-aspartyl-peptidase (threonine type)
VTLAARGPVVAIHGGAGTRTQAMREHKKEWHVSLRAALDRARTVLEAGGTALDAAQAAVALMEDGADQLNAGRGSALCSDGSVEMSAALMRGSDRAAGAVAGLRRTRNPIAAARLVLDSPQVLMVGASADELASAAGLEQCEPGYFVTEAQLARLRAGVARDRAGARAADVGAGPVDVGAGPADGGTVGAACLDADGWLAAATSTGGLRGQPPGRVGDTPLIGAGTWADATVAVSCTGDGEAFIRAGVARQLAGLVRCGVTLEEAARRALEDVAALGGAGGLVALHASGELVAPFLTEAMPRGVWRAGQAPQIVS